MVSWIALRSPGERGVRAGAYREVRQNALRHVLAVGVVAGVVGDEPGVRLLSGSPQSAGGVVDVEGGVGRLVEQRLLKEAAEPVAAYSVWMMIPPGQEPPIAAREQLVAGVHHDVVQGRRAEPRKAPERWGVGIHPGAGRGDVGELRVDPELDIAGSESNVEQDTSTVARSPVRRSKIGRSARPA